MVSKWTTLHMECAYKVLKMIRLSLIHANMRVRLKARLSSFRGTSIDMFASKWALKNKKTRYSMLFSIHWSGLAEHLASRKQTLTWSHSNKLLTTRHIWVFMQKLIGLLRSLIARKMFSMHSSLIFSSRKVTWQPSVKYPGNRWLV